MLYVALGALVVAALAVVSFVPVLRFVVRQSARERELLVNQILWAARTPWQEPPRDLVVPDAPPEDLVLISPEQRDW